LHNGLLIPNWSCFSVCYQCKMPHFFSPTHILSISTLKNVVFILKGEIQTPVLSQSDISFFRADSWDSDETWLATSVGMEAVTTHLSRYAAPVLLFILEALSVNDFLANEFLLPISTVLCHPYCKHLQRDCSRL